MEDFGLKDIIYLGVLLTGIIGSWFATKYEGKIAIALLHQENNQMKEQIQKMWSICDAQGKLDSEHEARLREAVSMEQAESKFVTRREFDITVKQLDVDVKAVKSITQNTLDTLQTLVMQSRER